MTKEVCFECAEIANWCRSTQFAGDHYYCESCAQKEVDFEKSDSSFYWYKINSD